MRSTKDDKLVKMFKALGHPNRLRLFQEIRQQGERAYETGHVCFLQDVMDALKVGAPTVSHHLKELVSAGLVRTAREGKYVTCRIDERAVAVLGDFLAPH